MRGGERSGSRHMPRVVLMVGAMEGVGLVERAADRTGAGLVGFVIGVGVESVMVWSVEVASVEC